MDNGNIRSPWLILCAIALMFLVAVGTGHDVGTDGNGNGNIDGDGDIGKDIYLECNFFFNSKIEPVENFN